MRLLTWLTAAPLDEVTPATRGWLAAERDARIAELEAQLAASEDEKRRFQRMYGKASTEIGRVRADLARERQARAETVLTGAQTAAVKARLSWGPARQADPADTARVGDADCTPNTRPFCWAPAPDRADGAAIYCTRRPQHRGQHVSASRQTGVEAVWHNTADADAALVATAEHLGNEVGPDRTAAIEGAAFVLRAHLISTWTVTLRAPGAVSCLCGWEAAVAQWAAPHVVHAHHVAEQLAAVGALGNLQLSVESSPPDLIDRDGDRWRWVRSGYSRAVERPKTRAELDLNWGPVRDADPEEVPF